MGTILTNPWDLNFGILAKRAETFAAYGASVSNRRTKKSTLRTNCDILTKRGDFHVIKEIGDNPNPNNYTNISSSCAGIGFPEPVRGQGGHCQNCTVADCLPRYWIAYTLEGGDPITQQILFPENDTPGRQYLDTTGDTYPSHYVSGSDNYYEDEADATKVRNALVEHWNTFRAPAGCSDQNALNYSPAASTGPCPCATEEPVFPDARYLGGSTGGWPAQTRHDTTYNTINTTGDCSCISKPPAGGGYIIEEWSYQGMKTCGLGTEPAECFGGLANAQRATEFWEWDVPEVQGKSSNRKQEGSFTHAAGGAAPYWTYTVEDKSLSVCPPGHKCSNLKEEEFPVWVLANDARNFRVTTCDGECQKMGCMDEKAINYDPEAEIQPSQPNQPNIPEYDYDLSWNERATITTYYQNKALYETYKCVYCEGDNQTGSYDHDADHCQCVSGYIWSEGNCTKAAGKKSKIIPEKIAGLPFGLVVGAIVILGVGGILTTTIIAKKKQGV